jgi:hypothetical protein
VTKIEILVRHDVGARGESRYFAIADVRHAGEADTPEDLGDCRQRERSIGSVAGQGYDGHRQPERIERCQGNLQLRQTGLVILAVNELEWPDLLVQKATKRMLMRCDPRLNVIEPMITFGDNKG